jgi:hypothetical protein
MRPKEVWSAAPLSIKPHLVLAQVELGFTVRLIATKDPRSCESDDDLGTTVARADLNTFDHVPVRHEGRTVGILNRYRYLDVQTAHKPRTVGDATDILNDRNLIPAEAGILSFVMTADEEPCRLVVDGSRVNAIVTLSDLQKLPVRPAIFYLVTHLELLMGDLIRRNFPNEKTWLDCLSPDRRRKLEDKWKELEKDNLAIDKLSATEFCDKRDLVLRSLSPIVEKSTGSGELKRVEGLRNSVVHAGDYATTRTQAIETAKTVRIAGHWIEQLQKALKRPTQEAQQ